MFFYCFVLPNNVFVPNKGFADLVHPVLVVVSTTEIILFWFTSLAFSFDDGGNYDLPAEIDYILNITGHEKINFIGHSQGTTEFFAMAALRPEYNEKITLMTALAPVAYMQDITQPLALFVANYTMLIEVNLLLSIGSVFWFLRDVFVACDESVRISRTSTLHTTLFPSS